MRTLQTNDGTSPDEVDPVTLHTRRAGAGDQDSLAWLMTEFDPLLRAQARYRLGARLRRHCAPEDLVQETWVVALRRLPTLPLDEGPAALVLRAFLTSTLRNLINNMVRHAMRRGSALPLPSTASRSGADPLDNLQALVTGASTRAIRSEMGDILDAALEELSDTDREIIILRGIEELPNEEAAALLQISPNASAVRFHRALRKLRQKLPDSCAEWFPDPPTNR